MKDAFLQYDKQGNVSLREDYRKASGIVNDEQAAHQLDIITSTLRMIEADERQSRADLLAAHQNNAARMAELGVKSREFIEPWQGQEGQDEIIARQREAVGMMNQAAEFMAYQSNYDNKNHQAKEYTPRDNRNTNEITINNTFNLESYGSEHEMVAGMVEEGKNQVSKQLYEEVAGAMSALNSSYH